MARRRTCKPEYAIRLPSPIPCLHVEEEANAFYAHPNIGEFDGDVSIGDRALWDTLARFPNS